MLFALFPAVLQLCVYGVTGTSLSMCAYRKEGRHLCMRGIRRGGVFLDPYEYVETKLSMSTDPLKFLLPTHLYWVKATEWSICSFI